MVMMKKKKEKTGRAGFAVLFASLCVCVCVCVCVCWVCFGLRFKHKERRNEVNPNFLSFSLLLIRCIVISIIHIIRTIHGLT